ncbi:minor tail protein [Gordonia phage ObLaDi]|uniref:Minor tail protein n=3 Tax=Cafassovirus TaxID=3425056 RepID=A0A9E7QC48_9CAUD|nr:minor tail protein [Gordonia phage Cafasso]UVK59764.1 minor tail protein [Gordonia phage Aleemily]UXE03748.1 minor tail protein [Gordonia phage ObLaDi]
MSIVNGSVVIVDPTAPSMTPVTPRAGGTTVFTSPGLPGGKGDKGDKGDPGEVSIAMLNAGLDTKLGKLGAGQVTQVYARNSAGVDTGVGYSGSALANTIPIRDANGRLVAADPSAAGHVATKNFVDTTTPKIADGAVISGPNNLAGALGTWAPEAAGFVHLPHLFNDLAYNGLRGGAVTITQNGTVINSSNIPKIFEPNTTALSIALVNKATDIFVITVDLCVSFRYGTVVGIAMPAGFRGKHVVIEGWYNDTWNPIVTRTAVETGVVVQSLSVPTAATAGMTRLRYTISDFHSSASFRVSSAFAMAYNSPLLEAAFVSRGGGELYGPLTYNDDPASANELARRAYVDTKVTKQAGGNRVYATNSSGVDTGVMYSSAPTAATLMYRTTGGVTSVGDGTDPAHAVNKGQLDAAVGTRELASTKGQPNGYAALDAGGKVPISQLPSSIMEYKGVWNAATNTPTLANGSGDTGDVYRVTAAGTRNLGSGNIEFAVGDYVVYNAAGQWEKSDTTDAVASVAGLIGVITAAGLRTALSISNVDNTSDANKPISSATATALAGKVDKLADPWKIYSTSDTGLHGLDFAGNAATPWTIAQRGDGGRIKAGTPVAADDAATKAYVDGRVQIGALPPVGQVGVLYAVPVA